MTVNPRVLVIAGGMSHEREVSLRSGRRVAEALRDTGCEVETTDFDDNLLAILRRRSYDVVWPLLHGAMGEDGALRDVLELLDAPYVGSPPAACRTSWDKSVAKGVAADAGLSTPNHVALPHAVFRELGADGVLDAIMSKLGLPVVVKPVRGGSALGVSVVRSAGDLARAMKDAYAYGEVVLLESHVNGIELAVSVVDGGDGPRALPPVEIVADGGVYDYEARYTAGATEFFCPARLDDVTREAVQQAALTAHAAFGLRQVSRTDLIVDDEGRVWFLEVNVAPGMTETSLLPQSVEAAGMSTGQVYRELVDAVLPGSAVL